MTGEDRRSEENRPNEGSGQGETEKAASLFASLSRVKGILIVSVVLALCIMAL